MGMLELLLGDAGLERTITIKTKPTKKEDAPEAPLDPRSANLPQPVMDLMGGGSFQGQTPMAWGDPQLQMQQQMMAQQMMQPQQQQPLPNFYQGG
jgi:hypothetical protein